MIYLVDPVHLLLQYLISISLKSLRIPRRLLLLRFVLTCCDSIGGCLLVIRCDMIVLVRFVRKNLSLLLAIFHGNFP